MKILQLGKFYDSYTGGIETVIYDITETLNERGVSCDVLCANKNNLYQEEFRKNYKIMRTKTWRMCCATAITPQMIFTLRKIINEYDIVHIHAPDPMATLALFCVNTTKQKIVLHWHSDIIKQKYLLKLYAPLQNWLLKKADKIITTTPKYRQESAYLQNFQAQCVDIPIGINRNKLIADEAFVTKIKHQYQGKKIIFSLGRLVYYKGFEYLIKSAQYLNDDYVILIGGDGYLKQDLQNLIKDNGLQDRVKLVGKIDETDLGSYYKACDVFCLPSIVKSEAFGIVQVEAMSFGKPVVATTIAGSGVDWVNLDGVSGVNVSPKQPQALANAFIDLFSDNDRYNQYCIDAKQRFQQIFVRDKMVDSVLDLYKKL